jgi:hypothetical protein
VAHSQNWRENTNESRSSALPLSHSVGLQIHKIGGLNMASNPVNSEQQAKLSNIEFMKYQNCATLSYEQKLKLVVPFINVLIEARVNPVLAERYLDAHQQLINREIMVWALDLAEAYYDAYKYFHDDPSEYFRSAQNLGNVAFSISKKLNDIDIGVRSRELDLKLGMEIGAPEEDLREVRQIIAWLKSLK